MHYAAVDRFRLWRLDPGMKILLTLYCLSVLLGLALSVVLFSDRAGLSYRAALRHYRGNAPPAEAAPDRLEDGAPPPLAIQLPMSPGRVVEILHPHLFSVPIVLFLLCHLFALTAAPPPLKIACYAASFGGLFLAAGGMWLATLHPAGVRLLLAGGTLFLAAATWMPIAVIASAWSRRPAPAPSPATEPEKKNSIPS